MATELLQPRDLACGTLSQSSCVILTSPTDCSDDSWRDTFSGSMNMALCEVTSDMQHSRKTLTYLLHNTHTHPFNGPLSGTTKVSQYQKGKTNLDFTEARDSEWQWHQLGHMQVCTLLQTDNHASQPTTQFFTGRMPFLSPNQQRQSTEGTNLLTYYTNRKKSLASLTWNLASTTPPKVRLWSFVKPAACTNCCHDSIDL